MQKKVLVSGGFGFIGSRLTRKLVENGFKVGVLARGIPEYCKDLSKKIAFYQADITGKITSIPKERYDFFIHLAAANDVVSKQAEKAVTVTTLGTRNCLEFCQRNNIKKIIYFSTFQVYGAESGSIDEESPVNCRNDYALTHYCAEQYVRMFQREFGIDYAVLRPTNIFGELYHSGIDRWSLVPNCFCREAYEKQTITLRSSGFQRRDFIDLEDISDLVILICSKFDRITNQVINLARGQSLSVRSVAEMVQRIYKRRFGRSCKLIFKSQFPNESKDLIVSTAKLKSLGYRFAVPYTMQRAIDSNFKLLMQA